eukprot:9293764-Lingulodinium_polyedra.AAC.1
MHEAVMEGLAMTGTCVAILLPPRHCMSVLLCSLCGRPRRLTPLVPAPCTPMLLCSSPFTEAYMNKSRLDGQVKVRWTLHEQVKVRWTSQGEMDK